MFYYKNLISIESIKSLYMIFNDFQNFMSIGMPLGLFFYVCESMVISHELFQVLINSGMICLDLIM